MKKILSLSILSIISYNVYAACSPCNSCCMVDDGRDRSAVVNQINQQTQASERAIVSQLQRNAIDNDKALNAIFKDQKTLNQERANFEAQALDNEKLRQIEIDSARRLYNNVQKSQLSSNNCLALTTAQTQAKVQANAKASSGGYTAKSQQPKKEVISSGGYAVGQLSHYCEQYGTQLDISSNTCKTVGNKSLPNATSINAGALINGNPIKSDGSIIINTANLDPTKADDKKVLEASKDLQTIVTGVIPSKQLTPIALETAQGKIYNTLKNASDAYSSIAGAPFSEWNGSREAKETSDSIKLMLSKSILPYSTDGSIPQKFSKLGFDHYIIYDQRLYNKDYLAWLSEQKEQENLSKELILLSLETNKALLNLNSKLEQNNILLGSTLGLLQQTHLEPKLKAQALEADEAARRKQ